MRGRFPSNVHTPTLQYIPYDILDCHSIGTAPESNDEGNGEGWKEKKGRVGLRRLVRFAPGVAGR